MVLHLLNINASDHQVDLMEYLLNITSNNTTSSIDVLEQDRDRQQFHLSSLGNDKNGNHSAASTNTEIVQFIVVPKLTFSYWLLIILLSAIVLLAIVFVFFGLFMKAGAYMRSDPRYGTSMRRLSFLSGEVDPFTGEGTGFGPSGFGDIVDEC